MLTFGVISNPSGRSCSTIETLVARAVVIHFPDGPRGGLRLLSNFQNLLLRQLELKALSKSAGAGDKPGDVDQPDIDVDKPREDTSIDKQMHC